MVLARPHARSMTEINSKKQFIFSQTFHRTSDGRIQEITTGERFKPQILEPFNPVT
jgi:hypothetical protein